MRTPNSTTPETSSTKMERASKLCRNPDFANSGARTHSLARPTDPVFSDGLQERQTQPNHLTYGIQPSSTLPQHNTNQRLVEPPSTSSSNEDQRFEISNDELRNLSGAQHHPTPNPPTSTGQGGAISSDAEANVPRYEQKLYSGHWGSLPEGMLMERETIIAQLRRLEGELLGLEGEPDQNFVSTHDLRRLLLRAVQRRRA